MAKKLYVQERKSCTSKKGILGPGDEVLAKYFDDGEKAIERLEKKGVIGTKSLASEKKELPKPEKPAIEDK